MIKMKQLDYSITISWDDFKGRTAFPNNFFDLSLENGVQQ